MQQHPSQAKTAAYTLQNEYKFKLVILRLYSTLAFSSDPILDLAVVLCQHMGFTCLLPLANPMPT